MIFRFDSIVRYERGIHALFHAKYVFTLAGMYRTFYDIRWWNRVSQITGMNFAYVIHLILIVVAVAQYFPLHLLRKSKIDDLEIARVFLDGIKLESVFW